MGKTNQNIKLLIIIIVILGTSFVYNKIKPEKKVVGLKKEIIYNSHIPNKNSEGSSLNNGKKLDVNDAELEDYLKAGITLSKAKKILEYKGVVGRIDNLEELTRVSGIGEKTVENLSEDLEAGSGGKRNRLKINVATEKELMYYGFTKEEIKKIKTHIKEDRSVHSNVEMMDILGRERYKDYEDILVYN